MVVPFDADRVFRLLAENSSDAIWVVTVDDHGGTTVEYANPACAAVLGAPPAADDWLDAVAAADRARLTEVWRAFLVAGGDLDTDCRLAPTDRPSRWLRLVGFTIGPTPRGGDRRAVVAYDRTAHQMADEGRRQSENLLRLIADNLPGYLAYVSADDLVYRFVNHRFEVGFGRPRDAIEGHHIREIIGESNYAFALPFIESVRAGQATHYENAFQLADGPAWARVNYVPDVDADGRVVGIVVLTYDVTEARRAREALRQERDFAELLVDATHAIVLVIDRDGAVVRLNRFGAELVGWPADDARGSDGLDMFPEDARGAERHELAEAFEGRGRQGRISPVVTRAGAAREIAWYYRRLSGATADPDALLCVGHDVTDARRAEADRLALEQQLLQSQKLEAIGKLAGGVAHDVNNVLAAVTGLASLLQAEVPLDSPAAEMVAELLSVSRRGAELTRNLLGFARKGRYRVEPTCVNALVRQVAAMLRRTIAKDVAVITALDAEPSVVEGDPSQLAQAILNLTLNAVDAVGTSGAIRLGTSSRVLPDGDPWQPEVSPGRYIVVDITDDGVGMTPETLRRATEPFFTTKPAGRGTGLGLAMAHGTVTGHGGAMNIRSQLARGTTITLVLPASDAPLRRAPGRDDDVGARPAEDRGVVLLVEDESTVRRSTSRLLERLGYHVREAPNGLEAVERFTADPDAITLVVLDMIMPVMDGATAFRHLRARSPRLPILLCTAHQDEALTAELLAQEHVALLAKPYDLQQLAQATARLLGR
ncbi:MAG: hypothetical protein CVU56_19480 [Deltaproteobacteria bacterium HGW-Deltaproteobacteria-14]|nr:MAG: hypothetical protein CVU56_19480 [Deltaproteobacteria bacterium HGW-Deltaproteobacteria-14]